ncbi:MAG TPA: hypothetical protein VJZ00_00255, partial [Thermoanaerobaculia bacterium]|nr:hypothetical protein [Thermoanaerobaculia bacterium]
MRVAIGLLLWLVSSAAIGAEMSSFGRYRVAVKVAEGADRDQTVAEVAAIYRARLEPFREIAFDGFVGLMSSASAELMRKDPRVVSVEELPQMEPPAPSPAMVEEKRPQEVRTPVAHTGSETWTTGSYSYDGSGNIRSMGSDTFVYDAFGRVTSGAAGPGRRQDYTYDRFGNLTSI